MVNAAEAGTGATPLHLALVPSGKGGGAHGSDGNNGKGTVSGNMVAALLHRGANPAVRPRLHLPSPSVERSQCC